MLTQTQKDVLEAIQGKLIRGDIKVISEATGFTTVYVGNVLSPSNDAFNQEIVDTAVKIVERRDQVNKNHLKKLTQA